nr:hypothetical protein B0A51_05074 [Rachicladosporium sp. CCFEE 5018]
MKPIETSQHIGEHTTSPAEASSAMRRLETGTSFSEKAPFRPPGVARIGPTPAMKSMALVIRSQILTPAHGTIMLPGRDRLKPKTRQISAGEKVFGIVELGEAILCQVGMRRLFLSRRVSKTFRDLIDTSRDLTEAMFTTYETLAIAMPNILNPLLGGSSQRDCRQLLFFKDFHAYHQPAENEWSFLGDTYCIKLRIVLDDDADLRRLSIFVRQQLSGSWLDTLLTSQPAEVMYSFVPSGQRLSFHMENACSLSCAGACGTLRMVQDDERVAEED